MQNRVKQVIESKAYTPSRFADHIGVPRATISHILSGRNKPSLEVVQKILDAFPDISAEWLVKGKGSFGKPTLSLFDPDEIKENVASIQADAAKRKEPIVSPPKKEEKNVQSADKENIKNTPSTIQDHNSKRSVKVIIMYSDGTYSEHSPSS